MHCSACNDGGWQRRRHPAACRRAAARCAGVGVGVGPGAAHQVGAAGVLPQRPGYRCHQPRSWGAAAVCRARCAWSCQRVSAPATPAAGRWRAARACAAGWAAAAGRAALRQPENSSVSCCRCSASKWCACVQGRRSRVYGLWGGGGPRRRAEDGGGGALALQSLALSCFSEPETSSRRSSSSPVVAALPGEELRESCS
jgi:hypothetical protein